MGTAEQEIIWAGTALNQVQCTREWSLNPLGSTLLILKAGVPKHPQSTEKRLRAVDRRTRKEAVGSLVRRGSLYYVKVRRECDDPVRTTQRITFQPNLLMLTNHLHLIMDTRNLIICMTVRLDIISPPHLPPTSPLHYHREPSREPYREPYRHSHREPPTISGERSIKMFSGHCKVKPIVGDAYFPTPTPLHCQPNYGVSDPPTRQHLAVQSQGMQSHRKPPTTSGERSIKIFSGHCKVKQIVGEPAKRSWTNPKKALTGLPRPFPEPQAPLDFQSTTTSPSDLQYLKANDALHYLLQSLTESDAQTIVQDHPGDGRASQQTLEAAIFPKTMGTLVQAPQ